MFLKRLRLLNFRNHKDFQRDFDKTNIILGPNTSGKTNLLEAIYLLSTTKSFRTNLNQNLISFGSAFSKIEGEIEENNRLLNLELLLIKEPQEKQKVKKGAKIDNKPKPLIFFLGTFLAVLFTPESLNLILGPPSLRRQAMDLILSQVSKKYTQNLIEFLKALKQRNRLLLKIKEEKANPSLLDFWDQRFLATSAFLRQKRREFLQSLNIFLPKDLRLLYLPSPSDDLEGVLRRARKKEIEFGFSLFGPQKDDFIFLKNKKSLNNFGSRGEIREGAIYFKLAEFAFIKQKTGSLPVLLLDDIFSELDQKRKKELTPLEPKGQIILTTTSLSSLNPKIIKQAKIIELE